MTQEDKELLLKDLCARLQYGVKINNEIQGDFVVYGVCENYIFARTRTKHGWVNHVDFHIEKVKPYLFPLSSMTEEQKREYIELLQIGPATGIDWLNAHYFDYRGLIPMGLAIDATDKNIY